MAIGCQRWFDLSITATGRVALCCMDGRAEHCIGDINNSHALEIYNGGAYRALRERGDSRLDWGRLAPIAAFIDPASMVQEGGAEGSRQSGQRRVP